MLFRCSISTHGEAVGNPTAAGLRNGIQEDHAGGGFVWQEKGWLFRVGGYTTPGI